MKLARRPTDNRRNVDTRMRYGQGLLPVKDSGMEVDLNHAGAIRGRRHLPICAAVHAANPPHYSVTGAHLPEMPTASRWLRRKACRNVSKVIGRCTGHLMSVKRRKFVRMIGDKSIISRVLAASGEQAGGCKAMVKVISS